MHDHFLACICNMQCSQFTDEMTEQNWNKHERNGNKSTRTYTAQILLFVLRAYTWLGWTRHLKIKYYMVLHSYSKLEIIIIIACQNKGENCELAFSFNWLKTIRSTRTNIKWLWFLFMITIFYGDVDAGSRFGLKSWL